MARKRVTIERDFFGNVTRYEERSSSSLFDDIFDDDDEEIIVVERPVRGRRVRPASDEEVAIVAGGVVGLAIGAIVGAVVGGKKK